MSDTGEAPPAEQLERMYRLMVTATLTGDRTGKEAKAGRLQAAFYPVRGMEGVCAALGATLRSSDQLVSTYRNLGDALAKGMPLRDILAELYGRQAGCSKGKGGPMHLHDTSAGLMATTGIVGSGLPIAVGLGVAAQLDGDGRAVAVTFGDGATSIGGYHEAMNLAALWRLPVLFVCQNNMWAEHTPVAEYTAAPDFAARAGSYGMRAERVDGFDPMSTHAALRDALGHIRDGHGPAFVECVSYRLTGHTGTADYSYVPEDELVAALRRDPAPAFREWLAERGMVTAARLEEIERDAQSEVDAAFDYAESCAPPPADELHRDVFADRELVADLR